MISSGQLPPGITVEMLSGPHLSRLRNRRIAETFRRVGAIEAWGRGTSSVIDECRKYGTEPPVFREQSGMLVVTFKAPIGPAASERGPTGAESRACSRRPRSRNGKKGTAQDPLDPLHGKRHSELSEDEHGDRTHGPDPVQYLDRWGKAGDWAETA
ncbi:MAG: hypothetical protein FJ109_05385 [Deltaproteobacteria bacterium]|nr:hypothetical protein [Deltaproteobacteria bacterium]